MQQRHRSAVLTAMLVAGLILAALAGCEGEASVDAQAEAQDQTPATEKKAPTPRDIAGATASSDDGDAQTAAAQSGAAQPGAAVETQPIYDLLAEAVEAAVKVDTFDDLMERFAEADRKRLGRVAKDALNAQATALRDVWQQRFEGEFNIIDSAANFKPMTRVERLQPSGDGNDRARVVVQPREPGQQPFELVLVREGEKWRIDLPDDVDRQKLQDALAKRLEALKQQSAKWTTDQIPAHRDVAYEALSAMAPPAPKPNDKRGARQPGG